MRLPVSTSRCCDDELSATMVTISVDVRALPVLRLATRFASVSSTNPTRRFAVCDNDHFFPVSESDEIARGRIDETLRERFWFNGKDRDFGSYQDWLIDPSTDVEWYILLHKFYDAAGFAMTWRESGDSRYLGRWMEFTSSWIAQVASGWIAAYATGRRVQTSIYALYIFGAALSDPEDEAAFCMKPLPSLQKQVRFLIDDLTPARNLRTLQLYVISLVAVAYLEFEQASYWRAFAFAAITANVQGDIPGDGVQRELPLQCIEGLRGEARSVRVQMGQEPHSCTDTSFLVEHTEVRGSFSVPTFSDRFLAPRKNAAGDVIVLHCDRGVRLEREGLRVAVCGWTQ